MKSPVHSRWFSALIAILLLSLVAPAALAQNFKIDPTHTFVQFRISHLGFSILNGRFNEVKGHFYYDKVESEKSFIKMEVNTASVDTNHAERDKHLRNKDFLDVEKYPIATFNSVSFDEQGKSGILTGELNLHGVTKTVEIYVQRLGAGEDPWGGYRMGFKGQTTLRLKDFGINYNLGPASEELHLDVYIEGIRSY